MSKKVLITGATGETGGATVREAIANLPDASGTARLIGKMERIFVAAPDYLARHGRPERPADLEAHRIVSGPVAPTSRSWRFERGGEIVEVEIHPVVSTNDTAGALAAATCGLGITPTSET